jgi:class 3 adenylate cyclase
LQSNPAPYDQAASVARIDEILSGNEAAYEELDSIPPRERLSFTNGFYVNCSALFIDIRGSSTLPDKYRQRTLAKIYRSYISEVVAVIKGNEDCAEIMIIGDAVSAVFDTPKKRQIDGVFNTVAQLNSLVQVINCRLKHYAIDPVRAGIGVAWGRALMIKAGRKGSAISDVVWMGHVVNRASKLCSLGSKGPSDAPIMIDRVFGDNLKDDYKKLLTDSLQGHYTADVVNVAMEEWRRKNC